MKYPEYIMRDLRQREDLEPGDTSQDEELQSMDADMILNEVCNWNGFVGWSQQIKNWVEDIYGVDLNEINQLK